MKVIDKIVKLLPKLNTEDFLGLAILLNVPILTQNWVKETRKAIPRDGQEIINDCIQCLNELEEKEQKYFYSIIKKSAEK